ncbi:MAG: DNA polymerase IV, partial [Coriobacteriia bacterium]|nr:DNA polymerase IV [Coriobacteriia bacterium]
VAQRRLKQFGIRTLRDLAAADEAALQGVFGKNAQLMRDRARGIDSAVCAEHEPAKSVSNEISVSESVSTRRDVEALMTTMAHKVGRRLRRKNIEGSTLHLKVRYENLKIRTCQRHVPDLGTNELTWLPTLSEMLDELWHEGVSLRLVGVGVSGFDEDAPLQSVLFELPPTAKNQANAVNQNLKARAKQSEALLKAGDAIAQKFGENAVRFGHELRSYDNTTGSSAKNPADYKN